MIKEEDNLFSLTTNNTSYLISITETGHVEHLYYGKRLSLIKTDIDALRDKHHIAIGTATAYNEEHAKYFLDNICLETSTEGKGDYRAPMLTVEYGKGLTTLDFLYDKYTIVQGKPVSRDGNAQSYASDKDATTLTLILKEKILPLTLELTYTTFDASDCIVRKARLTNEGKEDIVIRNFSSLQLDLFDANWDMVTFNGAWARERIPSRQHLMSGMYVNESRTGLSSNQHNPLLFLCRPDATEETGDVIGCNLIYSGNHRESVEVSTYGKTRLLTGINEASFRWPLHASGSFATPEAVLTASHEGFGKASANFHNFINNHIIRGIWKFRERPILVNNWEATYFNFTEEKLLALAKEASSLGIELFVLDDGWFGSRNDDTSSLGDWFTNPQKLPSGLPALSDKIHAMGLMFGLWFEPEMVSIQSQLYRKHPDWMVALPMREPSVGRHQYLLDITRTEVRDYLFTSISAIMNRAEVNYIKWDMNRLFSDCFSRSPDIEHMGAFNHRYVLALYELLGRLTKAFPNVLFEGCASGGNRFDLGMLCYFSQIWTSDNTDAYCRSSIQEGTSYGYPPSTMGCHVSACPNQQTLRMTDLETRFNIAAFGDLGYELDLTKLCHAEKEMIKEQITFYKQFRSVFQYGTFTRDRHDNIISWTSASKDKTLFLSLWFQPINPANTDSDLFILKEAEEKAVYEVFPRPQRLLLSRFKSLIPGAAALLGEKIGKGILDENLSLPSEVEHYVVSGSVLKYAGIKLNQQFSGTGFDGMTRILGDFGSRLYVIKKR